jgi:hypothetical protein
MGYVKICHAYRCSLAPTAELSTNTTQIATTALCYQIQISIIPLVSPAPYLLWLVHEAIMSITSESGGT